MTKIIKNFGYPIAVTSIIMGMILKILHFQYSELLLLIGAILLLFTLTFRLTVQPNKVLFDYAQFSMIATFILNYLFALFHWQYQREINFAFLFFLAVYLINGLYHISFNKNNNNEKPEIVKNLILYQRIINSFYIISGIAIVFGAIFMIMHWPYGNVILVFGLSLIVLTFLIDFIKKRKAA